MGIVCSALWLYVTALTKRQLFQISVTWGILMSMYVFCYRSAIWLYMFWWLSARLEFSLWLTAWWHHQMETFYMLLALCEGNPLVTKASDAELWCFLWSVPEQTVEQTIETPVIWDAIALFRTSLLCHCGIVRPYGIMDLSQKWFR